MALWATLDADERRRMEDLVRVLATEIDVEAARGFSLDARAEPLVLAHAALLVLGLELRHLRDLRSVVLFPTTMSLPGTFATEVRHVVRDGTGPLHGQATQHGPVVVSWEAALRGSTTPWTGRNVLLHEFAHKLDMRDGAADGSPGIGHSSQQDRFNEVSQRHFDRLRRGFRDPLLRTYGARNPAEFFAVTTEVFLGRPHELVATHPDLYEVYRDAYRQDPAARPPAGPPLADPTPTVTVSYA